MLLYMDKEVLTRKQLLIVLGGANLATWLPLVPSQVNP
jgi:hypothetical protein